MQMIVMMVIKRKRRIKINKTKLNKQIQYNKYNNYNKVNKVKIYYHKPNYSHKMFKFNFHNNKMNNKN